MAMKSLILILLFISFVFANLIIQEQNILLITPASADSTINPNGASELATLMRKMEKFSIAAREDVKNGKQPELFPVEFDKIHTAKVTPKMEKSEYYNSFADLYLMSVKNYTSSSPQERINTYNNMVSACLACHTQHCPGPVPAIKKMFIPVEE
jgi:hypothetical protein